MDAFVLLHFVVLNSIDNVSAWLALETIAKWYKMIKHNFSDEEHIIVCDMIAEIQDKHDGMN